MATPFVLLTPAFTLNGVDLTPYCKKFAFPIQYDDLDTTVFGTSGWRTRIGGLADSSISAVFNQDFTDNLLDEIIWGIKNTIVAWTIKPTSAATSASNPQYSGNVLISQVQPINNGVGELAEVSVTWPNSGAIARAVT